MTRSIISWMLTGVFTFAWYWVGYVWPLLQVRSDSGWEPVWMLLTIMVIVIQRKTSGAPVNGSLLDTIIRRLKEIANPMLGIIVFMLALESSYFIYIGTYYMIGYMEALVIAITCTVLTTLILATLDDATQ